MTHSYTNINTPRGPSEPQACGQTHRPWRGTHPLGQTRAPADPACRPAQAEARTAGVPAIPRSSRQPFPRLPRALGARRRRLPHAPGPRPLAPPRLKLSPPPFQGGQSRTLAGAHSAAGVPSPACPEQPRGLKGEEGRRAESKPCPQWDGLTDTGRPADRPTPDLYPTAGAALPAQRRQRWRCRRQCPGGCRAGLRRGLARPARARGRWRRWLRWSRRARSPRPGRPPRSPIGPYPAASPAGTAHESHMPRSTLA